MEETGFVASTLGFKVLVYHLADDSLSTWLDSWYSPTEGKKNT